MSEHNFQLYTVTKRTVYWRRKQVDYSTKGSENYQLNGLVIWFVYPLFLISCSIEVALNIIAPENGPQMFCMLIA